MAIEIVDFPIKNGGSFHSYAKLPEGMIKTTGSQMFMDNYMDNLYGLFIYFPIKMS